MGQGSWEIVANEPRKSVSFALTDPEPGNNKRTTYSLLQLAQHNLDPLAPWTQWRLNRARYLQPEWKNQLNAAV